MTWDLLFRDPQDLKALLCLGFSHKRISVSFFFFDFVASNSSRWAIQASERYRVFFRREVDGENPFALPGC